jgi:hypothetical protein
VTLDDVDGIRAETQRRDGHRVDGRADRERLLAARSLADAPERHVRAEGFVVEFDRSRREGRADRRSERRRFVGAARHAEPGDAWRPRARETATVIELDVERSAVPGAGANRVDDRAQPIVRCAPEEGEREVHELRLNAAEARPVGQRGGGPERHVRRQEDRDEQAHAR